MTAINISTDIPSNCDTLEKINAWSASCLHILNSAANQIEGENFSQRAAQFGDYYVAANDTALAIGRTSFKLDPGFQVSEGKMWNNVLPLSDKPLTAAMKAN